MPSHCYYDTCHDSFSEPKTRQTTLVTALVRETTTSWMRKANVDDGHDTAAGGYSYHDAGDEADRHEQKQDEERQHILEPY